MQIRLLLLLCLIASCKGQAAQIGEPASCDTAAEHLGEVCDPLTSETFRSLCEVEEIPLVTPNNRACVNALRQCTEATLDRCNVHEISIGCADNSECPRPFTCDLDAEECVRCMRDADCASGRSCLMGLCFDTDSKFYRSFSMLFSQDAGVPAD